MAKIALVNTKGGVGKSTLAVHFGVFLAEQGPTLLIDGDPPQHSCAVWAKWRRSSVLQQGPTPVTICLEGRAIYDEGRTVAQNFMHTVIDVGGADTAGLRSGLAMADCVVVPVGASGFESAAITDLLHVVELARAYRPDLDVRVLLSRIDPRSPNEVARLLETLQEEDQYVLRARIHERVAFRRTIREGATAMELKRDRLAITEISDAFREVMAPRVAPAVVATEEKAS